MHRRCLHAWLPHATCPAVMLTDIYEYANNNGQQNAVRYQDAPLGGYRARVPVCFVLVLVRCNKQGSWLLITDHLRPMASVIMLQH